MVGMNNTIIASRHISRINRLVRSQEGEYGIT